MKNGVVGCVTCYAPSKAHPSLVRKQVTHPTNLPADWAGATELRGIGEYDNEIW